MDEGRREATNSTKKMQAKQPRAKILTQQKANRIQRALTRGIGD